MSKQAIQRGERIAAYGYSYSGGKKYRGEYGTIRSLESDGDVTVQMDGDDMPRCFHPKQLRRLISSKRRRVWIYERDLVKLPSTCDGVAMVVSSQQFKGTFEDIEFIEVKKKP